MNYNYPCDRVSTIMTVDNLQYLPKDVQARKDLDMRAGDTVRVTVKIIEKGKTRLQVFEGLVIARKHGKENGGTFTVRRIASGVGVERVFPLYSPMIESIEVLKRSRVRRSKIYFIRDAVMKKMRYKLRRMTNFSTSSKDLDPVEALTPTDEAEINPEDMEAEKAPNPTDGETETPASNAAPQETEDISSEEPKEDHAQGGQGESKEEKKE